MNGKILVVDDIPVNVKLLADILTAKGYDVTTASSGAEALSSISANPPDLVLLDVMMPGMTGYEVCEAVRANPATAMLPIVLVTALDPKERVRGLEAGADDFLTKPINQPELLARVRSLLRIKTLYDKVEQQSRELVEWNSTLETRVSEQLAQIERMSHLKRFVSPQVCDLILTGRLEDPLRTRRCEITVVFTDLRGFTEFAETAEPEELMGVLREYHETLGAIALTHHGTIEHFAGDGVMILVNDPVPIEAHELAAVRMALEMREAVGGLAEKWRRRDYDLGFGVGLANGFATVGAIGFEGRRDYGAVGPVCNLGARLCAEAKAGQVLVSRRVYGKIEPHVQAEPVGELTLKGFHRPITAYNVLGLAG